MTNDERIDRALNMLFDTESEMAAVIAVTAATSRPRTLLALRELLENAKENA
jgi:hypothetical protein